MSAPSTTSTARAVAREFLAAMFGEDGITEDRRLVLSRTPGRPCFWADSLDAAVREIDDRNGDCLYGTCLQSPKRMVAEAERRGEEELGFGVRRGYACSAVLVPALRLDVDFGKKGSPPDLESALGLMDEMPERPSATVLTGGGVHPYWFLSDPFEIETDQDWQRAARAVKGWELVAKTRAQEHGWSLDPTGDLARCLRPPGYLSPKHTTHVIAYDPARTDLDRRYAFEGIEVYLPEDVPTSQMRNGPAADGAALDITDQQRERVLRWAEKMCEMDPQFGLTWRRERDELNDDSNRYDASLARYGGDYGLSKAQIATLIVEHRRMHGRDPDKVLSRPDLVDRVVTKYAGGTDGSASGKAPPAAGDPAADPGPAASDGSPAKGDDVDDGGERFARGQTDTGNAERLVEWYGARIRYVPPWRKFLVYDGGRWRPDGSTELVLGLTKKVTRRLMVLAAQLGGESEKGKKMMAHARASEARTRRDAMAALAKGEDSIHVDPGALDRKPHLVNFTNGTLDLRTGALREHDSTDLLTKRINYAYDSAATCPGWEKFLQEVVPDEEVRRFLRRAVGVSLVGETLEQVLFILHGPGLNGKTTLLEVLLRSLGEYARAMPPKLLFKRRGEQHPTELADLFGVRMSVCTDEPSVGAQWDPARVKALTGGDTISGRRMKEDFWNFTPSHSIWLALNRLPQVHDKTEAFWRRICVVPFRSVVPRPDKTLVRKLLRERQGILGWAVRGCHEYLRDHDLHPPAAVTRAAAEYRTAADPVASWLAETTRPARGAKLRSSELHEAYLAWHMAENQSGQTMTVKAFSGYVAQELGWPKGRDRAGAFWEDRERRSDAPDPEAP